MPSIQITITGDKQNIAKLSKLGQSLVMFEGAMNSIGKELSAYFAGQVFASQGGILGDQWPALSDEYALYKAKKYPGRGPLIRTGEMQSSFFYEADSQGVLIGNAADHFKYHQSDETRTSNLPRRTMMALTDDVKDIITMIIDADVERKIRMAGL